MLLFSLNLAGGAQPIYVTTYRDMLKRDSVILGTLEIESLIGDVVAMESNITGVLQIESIIKTIS